MIDLRAAALVVMENESPGLNPEITIDDNGADVCFGINKAYYSQCPIFEAPQSQRKGIAIDFYVQLGTKHSLNQLENQSIATRILDALTDPGPGEAGKTLQTVINQYIGHSIVAIDGDIGPKTIAAVNSILTNEKEPPTWWRFLSCYREALCYYFLNCALQDRTKQQYLTSWIKRVLNT